MKRRFLILSIMLLCQVARPQVMNAYARVSSISGTTLTVSNVNEVNHSFEDGDYIVIMQMQDDVIGTNTSDAVSFGNLSAIANAGRYEIRQITSHTETALVPTTITVSPALVFTYNTGPNGAVQVITLRRLGSPDYTTTGNITGLAWDGNIGGVVAIEVPGTLTLNHTISATGIGFRGGARSANYYDGTTNCISTPYRTNSTNHGFKGESIYKNTTATYSNARAKMLNGGGGGNHINGGGAGGGNFTGGGNGGTGWNGSATGCPTASSVGGLGGIALGTHISATRIFMGGGGGGAQQNDGVGTAGGNGGGIVLVKASTLRTLSGSCSVAPAITANGNAPSTTSGNDGSGGGGAAGTIVLQVNNYVIASGGCALTIAANGGNGGTVNNGSTHAGGGAGAQGAVIFSGAQPTTNVTTTTNNGTAGCSNSSLPCSAPAGSATGTANNGIITGSAGPLPISLLEFSARMQNNRVDLYWLTASETNNDYFTIERSADGQTWSSILFRQAAGNTNQQQEYADADHYPLGGVSYYRLRQTDFDGRFSFSQPVAVNNATPGPGFNIYPNPVSGTGFSLELSAFTQKNLQVWLTDMTGRAFYRGTFTIDESEGTVHVETGILPAGTYVVNVQAGSEVYRKKLLVQQ